MEVPDSVINATNGNYENSLHTWWSVVQLALAAVLVAWIAALTRTRARRISRGLTLLAVTLTAMSLDELMEIHEFASRGLDDIGLSTEQFTGWPLWVIPAVLVFVLLVMGLATQLRELPRRVRRLLVAAAFLFVASAGGLETIYGLLRTLGLPPWIVEVEILLEESGEAAAASLAIFALLLLRQAVLSPTSVRASATSEATPSAEPAEPPRSRAAATTGASSAVDRAATSVESPRNNVE